MKRTLVVVLMVMGFVRISQAQDVSSGGKTFYYYDEKSKKNVKEIFHFIEIIQIKPDKENYGSYVDTTIRVKHGPYSMYYETGKIMKTGYFRDGQPDSVWLHYNEAGKMIKREVYRKGQAIKQ